MDIGRIKGRMGIWKTNSIDVTNTNGKAIFKYRKQKFHELKKDLENDGAQLLNDVQKVSSPFW